ncbi:hypothetical protein [Hymenobacter fodinae]|uniref:Uncharacterized protein n=1 Tax=Hymenobacter fodinae TaxID=2510796 RepID=A0A4Z0P3B8_9BACT|nr:hypothetical protein [Hymenobacter fodinae]TGE04659.1 hypothetical protein EU556_20960 [Hymenobacter fodinae]
MEQEATTVDKQYKTDFNLGYVLAQTPETNEVLKKMIEQSGPERSQALKAGRREFMQEAIADKQVTDDKRPAHWSDGRRQEAEPNDDLFEVRLPDASAQQKTDEFRQETRELADPSEEQDARRIARQLEAEENERNPKEGFTPSDRVGQGPALSEAQKKEVEDHETSLRAKNIQREGREASKQLSLEQEQEQKPRSIFDRSPSKQDEPDRQSNLERIRQALDKGDRERDQEQE